MIGATPRDLETRFPTSGHPVYLEWYECFDDPADLKWISGRELIEHEAEWDDRQRAKWRFFYQPVATAVGRPQQGMIHRERLRVEELQRERRRLAVRAVVAVLVAIPGVFLLGWIDERLVLAALIALAIAAGVIYRQYRDWRRRKDLHLGRIEALEGEIRQLRLQIPSPPSAAQVESWLEEELREMELKCLADILGGDVTEARVMEVVRQEKVDDLVYGLLVRGWGVLQPAEVRGPMGPERTGLESVLEELGQSAVTWRWGSGGLPLCRVLYLQYVFPLENNLNVYAFFYDFVTRRPYGRRWETYQYNHVVSFSVREVEVGREDCVRDVELPEAFKKDFFGKQVHAFTLVMGGGGHFRCVLTDDAVVATMNRWLHLASKLRELESELAGRLGDLQDRSQADEQDLQTVRAQLERVLDEKATVEDVDVGKARKALRCIRLAVECATSRGFQGSPPLGSEPGPHQGGVGSPP